ncbi:MAG: hypothetical protein AAF579_04810 [Cyanobacteria bacterium P01_C01_bin.118]
MKIDIYSEFSGEFTLPAATLLGQPTAQVTTPVIAEQFEDTFFDRTGDIFGNFIESGQLWALLIGIVLGYVIRGITTY